MSKSEALSVVKKASCAVYGAGLTKSGALATSNLVMEPTATTSMLRPLRISRLNEYKIRQVAAGLGFSLFAARNELYGAGLNNYCQLGGPLRESQEDQAKRLEDYHISPYPIMLPKNPTIIGVSAGRLHSLVATSNGVYAFGDNQHGQCAQNPEQHRVMPKPNKEVSKCVLLPKNVPCRQVHCSLDSSFALLENGDLYSWGLSTDGQLGTGCTDIGWKPTKIKIDEPLKMVTGAGDTILAVSKTGKLYIWGQAEYNQMSEFVDQPQLLKPMLVEFNFDGSGVQSAAATNTSCIVTTKEGNVFTWGSMFLGSGPTVVESSRPIHLSPNLFADSRGRYGRVRRVFAGICTVAAINEADNLFTWGANRHGSLALGHENDQLFPFQVYLPHSVQKLALGPDHTIILTDPD